ncbi:hypothetical protein GCM10023212_06650 [Luteolibacter yonseiensis]
MPLRGQLLVTEIQSQQSSTATASGANDYWELTNFGGSTISLANYRWTDEARSFSAAVPVPAGTLISPGESVIFTRATAAAFRNWWGLGSNVQIFGTTGAPGLGPGDAITLFNASGVEIFNFRYSAAGFTRSNGSLAGGGHAGPSAGGGDDTQALIWDPTYGTASPRYTFATGVNFSTFKAAIGDDLGSPGLIGSAGSPPVVDFTVDQTSVRFGETVTFTATVGNATGDVSYQWDFGDGYGDGGSGAVVTHRYARGGNHTVSVTATAENGSDSKVKTLSITIGAFGQDGDEDGLADGLEYYFATNPESGENTRNLPRLVRSSTGMRLRHSTRAGISEVAGVFETSGDLVNWETAVPGLDLDFTSASSDSETTSIIHTLSGTAPSPAGQSADHLTPNLQDTAGAALGGIRVENLGMVGVGRISAATLDQFGETLGGSSGLCITGWSYDSGQGKFSGVLNMLPDRGFNVGSTFSNYAARVHKLAFTFAPYYGAGPVALRQVVPVYKGSTKFTYQDGAVTKFTTGLNPTGVGTLFGQAVGTVTTANGPGGNQLSLLSFDAEALQLLPDGSGFVSDEYGACIARFDSTRKITGITRLPEAARPHRPAGTLNFDSENTPTTGRRENQGIEGIAVTPDGTRLFALLQSGLVQDIHADAQTRNNTRLFVYDISGMLVDAPQLIGEYVVKLPRYDSNGNGSGINRTANQSEIVAIGPAQFLMLPQDGNGLGSDSTDPGVYKSVQLVDFGSATNILGQYDTEGAAVSPGGVLRAGIRAAASKDVVNILNPADHAKFGINTTNSAPDLFTLQEKLEGMSLVPDLSTSRTDDYFLFVANDNDFQSPSVRMLSTTGVIQNFGDGRKNVGNGRVTNDATFYVYRLLIAAPENRFFRMKVTN